MLSNGSKRKVWWICPKNHSWQATIRDRANGSGCPDCWNEKRSKKIIVEYVDGTLKEFESVEAFSQTVNFDKSAISKYARSQKELSERIKLNKEYGVIRISYKN